MGWLSGFAESSLNLSCWLPIVDASECPGNEPPHCNYKIILLTSVDRN